VTRRLGALVLGLAALLALAAPLVAPHPPERQHRAYPLAPPMPPRLVDEEGRWRRPFVYPVRLVDRLERRYAQERGRPAPLRAFHDGRLVAADAGIAWFPLGTDALGRDILSRLLAGARVSLGVALLACLGALALGALLGAVAGYAGGLLDEVLMRGAELVVVLPVIYLVLVVRAALPLVLPPAGIFVLLAGVLALAGWPQVARGVRGIVATERAREYAEAARALGASAPRVVGRHLLPAALPFLGTQLLLLLPAFILAEATLSFVGLGFDTPLASWGTMLQEAANIRALADTPWVLAPAAAIAVVVFGINLLIEDRAGR
jgi:peptide/nickel transport system permease protein